MHFAAVFSPVTIHHRARVTQLNTNATLTLHQHYYIYIIYNKQKNLPK